MSQKIDELSELGIKCSNINKLLKKYTYETNTINDRKAWRGFIEFIDLLEDVTSEYRIQDEYEELKTLRLNVGRLRTKRDKNENAGHFQVADRCIDAIQKNYENINNTIKVIQQQLEKISNEIKNQEGVNNNTKFYAN